jgi:hypothetical protein
MDNNTSPPLPELVVNLPCKQKLSPDKVKEVILAFLVCWQWSGNNQPILWHGIFREVGQHVGITRQQLHQSKTSYWQ